MTRLIVAAFFALAILATSVSGTAPCKPGYEWNVGLKRCQPCPEHHFSRGGHVQCEPCPAGTEAGRSKTTCYPCNYNKFNPAAAGVCKECPPGSYSLDKGATQCVSCTKRVELKHPDPHFCRVYMVCEPGKALDISVCPPGTCFDQETSRCADPVTQATVVQ